MSKSAISSIDKKNFYKLKPDSRAVFDVIKRQTNNKQNLRDVIMDYVIQKLFKQNQKERNIKSIKTNTYQNNLKKIPIILDVQVNQVKRKMEFNGFFILEKYIQFQKKNIYRQNSIEPLIVEILNFFDQMQEIADKTSFQLNQGPDLSNSIVNILVEKYHKQKQRATRIRELDIVKNKTIAKYTRVSYLDLQNKFQKKQCQIYVQKAVDSNVNSHRVSRDTIASSVTDKQSVQAKEWKNSKSKLKDLVDKYKVFQHPQKIEQLRKQKLAETYGVSQVQKVTQMIQKENKFSKNQQSQNSLKPIKGYGQNQATIDFLQNWISEMSISEKLYRTKLEQKQIKVKQGDIKVGKIIQQSQNQEERQNQQQNLDRTNRNQLNA